MISGKTKSGFEYSIDSNVMDNMELLDAVAEIDGNPLALSKVLKMVLGDEQRKALYDHLRQEDGRVPVKAVSEEITDIFTSSGKNGKN